MKSNRLISIISIIAILAIGFVSMKLLISSKKTIKKEVKKESLRYVKAKKVAYTNFEYTINYSGRVKSSEYVNISSQVSGLIKKGDIAFKQSSSFRKGDILIQIEDDLMQASIKSSKSKFMGQMSIILSDIEIDFAKEYAKWELFFDAINLDKPLPKLPNFSSNKEKIFLSSRNIISQYYEILKMEINLNKHTIRAPFNGTIISCNAEVGTNASPNSLLAKIIRTDLLEIEIPINVSDKHLIKKGSSCSIIDKQNNTYTSRISRVSNYISPETQMLNIYAKIRNSKFLTGEYIDVEFKIMSTKKGIKINREALRNDRYIKLIKDNKIIEQKINVLYKSNDYYIVNGIDETSVIATESVIDINKKVIPLFE